MTPFCDTWLPNTEPSLPRDQSVFFCNHSQLLKTARRLFQSLYNQTNGSIIEDARHADYVFVHSNSVRMWESFLDPFGVNVTDHVAADIGNIQTATLWVALARTLVNNTKETSGTKKVVYFGVASGAAFTCLTFTIDLSRIQAYYLRE